MNVIVILMAVVVSWPTASRAQQPPAAAAVPAEDLAKQLANPISSLVSVPFQFNWEQKVTLTSETSANWKVDEGRWAVPVIVVFGKLSSLGAFPASFQLGGGGFVTHPDVGPSWKVRGAVVILLPRRQ